MSGWQGPTLHPLVKENLPEEKETVLFFLFFPYSTLSDLYQVWGRNAAIADWPGLASQHAAPKQVLFHEPKSHLPKLAVSCGCDHGMDLTVYRRQLLQVCESQWLKIQEVGETVVKLLVAWDQPWWEYLHHRNWQILQIGLFVFVSMSILRFPSYPSSSLLLLLFSPFLFSDGWFTSIPLNLGLSPAWTFTSKLLSFLIGRMGFPASSDWTELL